MLASAHAVIVTVTPTGAQWTNVVSDGAGAIITDNSNSANPTMRWGSPATGSGQSGYDFAVAAGGVSVDVPPNSSPFALGTFTHINQPIFAGTGSLQSATLALDAAIEIAGIMQGVLTFNFDFLHNETPNSADPCADGGALGVGVNDNGCADIVTVTASSLSETFIVDGLRYTLSVLGFSQDGGATISNSFTTRESALNPASLYGSVSVSEVPIPGALPLLLSGMAGFAAMKRRRKTPATA
jgi:hypothetical protein